jgi:hypothetical protein
MLCRGEVPIYEPELEKLIADGRRRKRLHFISDLAAAVIGADSVLARCGRFRWCLQYRPERSLIRPVSARTFFRLRAM